MSGVSDQPMSDDETLRGAQKRARGCDALLASFLAPGDHLAPQFSVGLEGGLAPSRLPLQVPAQASPPPPSPARVWPGPPQP